ncbi:MAG: hypothetical protein ACYTG3_13755 [Planctomycetota bacterium]|jgi:hypothetical protein
MNRLAPLLLLLLAASAAFADEAAVREALDKEDFGTALARAEKALEESTADSNGVLRYMRAQAVAGLARDLQRAEGYAAALDYLEPRLDHPHLTDRFAATCMWAGEEERAIRALRASPVALRDRIRAELEMMRSLGRFEEASRRARAVGWNEAAEYYAEVADHRARLTGRARRAVWVALVGGLLILAAAGALFILAPAESPPPASRPGASA